MNTIATTKQDVYSKITDRIIAALEAGTAPWKSPYLGMFGFPKNYVTGKSYSGVNVFLLALENRKSPHWMTYKQAQSKGGTVRRGEKGTAIVYYGSFTPKVKGATPQAGEVTLNERERRFLKTYYVFNAEQIDGIEFPELVASPAISESEMIQKAEDIVSGFRNGPAIDIGNRPVACYDPSHDEVKMPVRQNFTTAEEYYGAFFHELGHSTGHETRLKRDFSFHRHSPAYAKEELIAEMTACFLNAEAGILEETIENSASYLGGWIKILRDPANSKLVVQAASQATKASAMILGDTKEQAA